MVTQTVIDAVHAGWAGLQDALALYHDICLMRFDHAQLLCLVAFITMGCIANRNKEKAEGAPVYWLQSLVATVLTTFGGGIIAPILIGRPVSAFVFSYNK